MKIMKISKIVENLLKLDSQIDISLYFSNEKEQDLLWDTINLIEKQNHIINLMAYHLSGIYHNKFGFNKEEVIKNFEKKVKDYDR